MVINKTDVQKIAYLAKISLDDNEISEMQNEISDILEMISCLNKIETHDVIPLSYPIENHTHYREDKVTEENGKDALIKVLNSDQTGLYLVPKVIE